MYQNRLINNGIKVLFTTYQKYEIRGEILAWIENYITDRTQKVVDHRDLFFSNWKHLCWSTPGISTKTLPFFFIYINNVVENISNQIRLFTDDTSLFVVVDENDNDAAK